jgi:hypothetical protein
MLQKQQWGPFLTNFKAIILVAALAASTIYSQQSTFSGETGVITHVVDGDGWQTSVSLNNIDAAPSQYKLSFFTETGTPLSLQTNLGTGTSVSGTIPARGRVTITTAGTNPTLTQGWAKMDTIFLLPGPGFVIAPGATIAGTVLFLRPPTVSRPIEVSEPLDFSIGQKWVLPFDHLNGYSSGVALVNPVTYQDISILSHSSMRAATRSPPIHSLCSVEPTCPSPRQSGILRPWDFVERSGLSRRPSHLMYWGFA